MLSDLVSLRVFLCNPAACFPLAAPPFPPCCRGSVTQSLWDSIFYPVVPMLSLPWPLPTKLDSVVMAGSVWGFQACQRCCIYRQWREKGTSKGWMLSKTLGNVTKSPLPAVPDEMMREMVLWSSGWGLTQERGHSGSSACSRTQSGATMIRWDWNRKLYTLKARAFKQDFL